MPKTAGLRDPAAAFPLPTAALGIIGNQVVAWHKLVTGRRINSATLVADARHSWLDALSSAGALAGLIAVALGFRWGDPVAGIAVTAFICHVGYQVTADLPAAYGGRGVAERTSRHYAGTLGAGMELN
jgi:divalent metal cation (Fe/Co/Zn/Cd) transporter